MSEGAPKSASPEDAKEKLRIEYLELAKELMNSPEALVFPGIDPEWYAKLKAVEEEFPEASTPTDEIIAKIKENGFKIALSEYDPSSRNIFILPANSDDLADSLMPKHLLILNDMDERLKKLIQLDRVRL